MPILDQLGNVSEFNQILILLLLILIGVLQEVREKRRRRDKASEEAETLEYRKTREELENLQKKEELRKQTELQLTLSDIDSNIKSITGKLETVDEFIEDIGDTNTNLCNRINTLSTMASNTMTYSQKLSNILSASLKQLSDTEEPKTAEEYDKLYKETIELTQSTIKSLIEIQDEQMKKK